jgi:two-component system, chemotaxis family, protein-glutamate methylesterase/glutaminase
MTGCELVVVGASWGGLRALTRVLGDLPADFAPPVLVAQHRQEGGGELLAGLLNTRTALRVLEAEDKAPLETGCVRLAPAGYHLLVDDRHLALSCEGEVRYSRPSIDVLFDSAARSFGARAVGVVLTGANDDGARGLRTLRARGAYAIVQDPADAEAPVMPRAALERAGADAVLPLAGIGPALVALAAGGRGDRA